MRFGSTSGGSRGSGAQGSAQSSGPADKAVGATVAYSTRPPSPLGSVPGAHAIQEALKNVSILVSLRTIKNYKIQINIIEMNI